MIDEFRVRVWSVLAVAGLLLSVGSYWVMSAVHRVSLASAESSCSVAHKSLREATAEHEKALAAANKALDRAAGAPGYAQSDGAGRLTAAVREATAGGPAKSPSCTDQYGSRKVNDHAEAIRANTDATRSAAAALEADVQTFELSGPTATHIQAFLLAVAAQSEADKLLASSDGKTGGPGERDALKAKLAALQALTSAPLDVTNGTALADATAKLRPATDDVNHAADAVKAAVKAKTDADAATRTKQQEDAARQQAEAQRAAAAAVAPPRDEVPVQPLDNPADYGYAEQQPVGGGNAGNAQDPGGVAQQRPIPPAPAPNCRIDPRTGRRTC